MDVVSWYENLKYLGLNFALLQQCYINMTDHDGGQEDPFGEEIFQMNEILSHMSTVKYLKY
jgi:hypothetical protein